MLPNALHKNILVQRIFKATKKVSQFQNGEEVVWIAKSDNLKGCVGQGETAQEAVNELESNELEFINTAKQCGIKLPNAPIQTVDSYREKGIFYNG